MYKNWRGVAQVGGQEDGEGSSATFNRPRDVVLSFDNKTVCLSSPNCHVTGSGSARGKCFRC